MPEIEGAVQFYTSALGLTLTRMLDEDMAELQGTSSIIYLLGNAVGSTATASGEQRKYSRHWTPVHIDFVVEDVAQAAKQAINAGAVRESEVWNGEDRSASLSLIRSGTAFV